jgi:hypothetical protein
MNAAIDPCATAFLDGVAQCQPASMRFLLRGLRAKGYSAGQVRHAATRLVAIGKVRVVSQGKPFLYALPDPDAAPADRSLALGPAHLPLTRQLLYTLEHAGKDGATRAALSALYAERDITDAAIGSALVELHQRTHRVSRSGDRGAYVFCLLAFAKVPPPRALGLVEPSACHAEPVALAPEWPAPQDSSPFASLGNAPAWRLAA